jgi:ubiquitin carboxyl-terminal hydrolase MINDY-1/2
VKLPIFNIQDVETASVIGSKSYNTLVAEYVTRRSEKEKTKLTMSEQDVNQDEESQTVDFAAACTAALGVPSPSLSRGLSFEDNPVPPVIPPAGEQKKRGDIEEEEELKRILDLSKSEISDKIEAHARSPVSQASAKVESSELMVPEVESTSDAAEMSGEFPVVEMKNENSDLSEDSIPKTAMPQTKEDKIDLVKSASEEVENSEGVTFPRLLSENISLDVNQCMAGSTGEQSAGRTGDEHDSVGTPPAEVRDNFLNGPESVDSEPIYQGEEHILNPRSMVYESPEPVYEGEVLLAENASKGASPNESGDEPEDRQCKCLFVSNSK